MASSKIASGKSACSSGTVGYRALSKIREELTCSICLEMLTDPRILSCHHSFCLDCLKEIIISLGTKPLKCPNCTKTCDLNSGSVADLPSDFKANSLLELITPIKQAVVEMKDTGDCGSNVPESTMSEAIASKTLTVSDQQSNNWILNSTDMKDSKERIPQVLESESELPQADDMSYFTKVKCPLCKEVFSIPRTLDCGDTFCMECIRMLVEDSTNSSKISHIECPHCMYTTYITEDYGIENLPLNSEKYGIMLMILRAVQEEFGADFFNEIPKSYQDLLKYGFVEGQNSVEDAEKMSVLLGAIWTKDELIDINADSRDSHGSRASHEEVARDKSLKFDDDAPSEFKWTEIEHRTQEESASNCCKCC